MHRPDRQHGVSVVLIARNGAKYIGAARASRSCG